MMDDENTNLMDYLPEYLKGYWEFKEIMGTESIELQNIKNRYLQCMNDRFPVTCGTYGLMRFEKMLKITPLADDSEDSRRFRILSKWNMPAHYNYAYLEEQLRILCGENGYKLQMDFAGPVLDVKIALTSKNMMDSVKEMLQAVLPCNVLLHIGLLYNQHKTLGKYTHGQMAFYTHRQLREDVIV